MMNNHHLGRAHGKRKSLQRRLAVSEQADPLEQRGFWDPFAPVESIVNGAFSIFLPHQQTPKPSPTPAPAPVPAAATVAPAPNPATTTTTTTTTTQWPQVGTHSPENKNPTPDTSSPTPSFDSQPSSVANVYTAPSAPSSQQVAAASPTSATSSATSSLASPAAMTVTRDHYTTLSATTPTPSDQSLAVASADLSTGGKVAIGLLVPIAVIGIALLFLFYRRKKQNRADKARQTWASHMFPTQEAWAAGAEPIATSSGMGFADGVEDRHVLAAAPAVATAASDERAEYADSPAPVLRPSLQQSTFTDSATMGHNGAIGGKSLADIGDPYDGMDEVDLPASVTFTPSAPLSSIHGSTADSLPPLSQKRSSGPAQSLMSQRPPTMFSLKTAKTTPTTPSVLSLNMPAFPAASLNGHSSFASYKASGVAQRDSMMNGPLSPADLVAPSPTGSSASAASKPSAIVGEALVKCSFIPSLPDELSIKTGERIFIVEEFDDGWATCRNLIGEEGMVPVECLERGDVPKVRWKTAGDRSSSISVTKLPAMP